MVAVKRVVLDVLKPHTPNALEFARAIAEQMPGYRVHLTVVEIDDKTETLVLDVSAELIDFDALSAAIASMGASLHSIDEVEVVGDVAAAE